MKDSEPNIASIIKGTYETLEDTRDLINKYRVASGNLISAAEQLAVAEANLNKIPEKDFCWNSQNCLGKIKRQKGLINDLTGALQYSKN